MKKEGFGGLLISKDAKVNTVLFLFIALIFLLTVLYTNAMSIKLLSPGNLTYNNSVGRNVNFTFNVTWDRDRENQSNCTLFINSTTFSGFSGNGGWVGVANRTNGTGISSTVDGIINNSISGINYTFSVDANYTWNIGCYNGTTNQASLTFFMNETNMTFFLDSSAPSFNFTLPDINVNSSLNTSTSGAISLQFKVNDTGYGLNMSANNSINLSIFFGGARAAIFGYKNSSGETNISCSAVSGPISTATTTCNLTYSSFTSNGTYRLNISAMDALGTYSTGIATLVTVDQIPPYITNISICANGTMSRVDACDAYGSSVPSQVQTSGGSGAQGKRIFVFANFTDNLTQPLHVDLQFFNTTSGSWQTVNTSTNLQANISNAGTNTNATLNFSFMPPIGRNEFEGRNITFRILVNDTLGNRNTNSSGEFGAAFNITVNFNDTTKPTVSINGTLSVNGSNLTNTRPIVSWISNDNNRLTSINISIDDTLAPSSGGNDGCKRAAFYILSASGDNNVETGDGGRGWHNGSFQVSSTVTCPLANGTHTVVVNSLDTWGNREIINNTFFIQSGGVPTLTLDNLTAGGLLLIQSAVNNTNLTSSMTRGNVIGLGFHGVANAVGVGGVEVANLTYVSSCNSSSTVKFFNNTGIYPFNESTCPTTSANRTLTVTVTDTAGNSNSTTFLFLVDNVAPSSIAVASPTNGQYFTNTQALLNFSVKDNDQAIAFTGYYLDGSPIPVVINKSGASPMDGAGVNLTFGNLSNFTPGTHTIKITANDSLGNVVNSSLITFTITGPLNFSSFVNVSLFGINTNISFVNLTDARGETLNNGSNSVRNINDTTLTLLMRLNGSQTINNISIVFNASAANWDKNFTFFLNDSVPMRDINSNFTGVVQELLWFNKSIQDFLPNNNSYYAIVRYKINASQYELGGKFELWYFPDIDDVTSKVNISTECSSSFSPSFTLTTSTMCWNNTDNVSINIYLPHFSGIAGVNNSNNPTVNVSYPVQNHTVSMFIPNISVSTDAISCVYQINSTGANKSMALSSQICTGSLERFANLETGIGYNFTFSVTDSDGNINRYLWHFNISDNTASNVPNLTVVSSSVSTTSATVSLSGLNESVNVTIFYGTSVGSLSSTARATSFNASQSVSISSLSASTEYHFNVTVCDFAGNCAKNGTFNFTTSAAASTTTTTTSSSSGGGGGGAVSNVVAIAGRQWDALAAGSTAVLAINNVQIAVTGVTVEVAKAVTNADITVESLSSNPYAAAASSKVYQYLNIKRGNIADSDTSKIAITFRVPKSWLATNGISEEDVVLYRYSNSQWSQLPTTKTGSDSSYVTYQSTTPGFSVFAVGTKGAAPVEQQPTTPPESQPIQPSPPQATPSETTPSEPTTPAEQKGGGLSSTTKAWIVVLVIVVVAAIGYFVWQRKKEE